MENKVGVFYNMEGLQNYFVKCKQEAELLKTVAPFWKIKTAYIYSQTFDKIKLEKLRTCTNKYPI